MSITTIIELDVWKSRRPWWCEVLNIHQSILLTQQLPHAKHMRGHGHFWRNAEKATTPSCTICFCIRSYFLRLQSCTMSFWLAHKTFLCKWIRWFFARLYGNSSRGEWCAVVGGARDGYGPQCAAKSARGNLAWALCDRCGTFERHAENEPFYLRKVISVLRINFSFMPLIFFI